MVMSAQQVAETFVWYYYPTLAKEPHLVHKFYKDTSKLVRVEDDGSTSTTTTTRAINEKILSLNTGNKFEIKTIDAQESSNMDVHVLVTGFETRRDNIVQHFAQSFLLERMEHIQGYYLLHDMFRYVGKANQLDDNQIPVPGQTEDRVKEKNVEVEERRKGNRREVYVVGDDIIWGKQNSSPEVPYLCIRGLNIGQEASGDALRSNARL
ncbi:NTF2 domain-containing protein [Heracleum sosnowskyi]|uniref:NTF2 domain-containing protein n=1 Tax=Heracleum sosnowskyi TaxID=360622 RepID=A0AAD8MQM7_9APIA|nr:NTF2 domain-containing protein [Heracleum sosnowskyi]